MNKPNYSKNNENRSNIRVKSIKRFSNEINKTPKNTTPPKIRMNSKTKSSTITKQENKKVVFNNQINIHKYSQIRKLKLKKDESTVINSNTIESDPMISLSQGMIEKKNIFKRIVSSPDVNYNSKSKKKQLFSSIESKRYQRRNYEFINNKYKKLISRYFSIKE